MDRRFLPHVIDLDKDDSGITVVDLDDDDDEQVLHEVEMVIDLTGDDDDQHPNPNPALFPNLHQGESHIKHNGFHIHIGAYVEVITIQDSCKAQFLKVTAIGGGFIRGLPLTRVRRLDGQLPKKLNEVCLIIDTAHGDPRTEEEQATIDVPLQYVLKPRDLVYTNAHYPAHKYRLVGGEDVVQAEDNGRLVCRWKPPPTEFALLHLSAEDVPEPEYRVSDRKRFNDWRGENAQEALGVWAIEPHGLGQKYSFGDLFCGAGGASCGGRKAGLDVRMGCDKNTAACDTYRENFPYTEVFDMDVNTLITSRGFRRLPKMDVVHLSPPCQTLSPAHTREGKNDDDNDAALFAVQDIIPEARARVFTLEETFGILAQKKHGLFFKKLVQCFTYWNHSIRWKVVDLRNWGVPMRRLRLLMIVSCPGEPLPEFPKHTHAENGADGLKPWTTVRQALSKIPSYPSMAPFRNQNYDNSHVVIPSMRFRPQRPEWDANTVLSRTITCSGIGRGQPGDYHPSGERKWTCRELATLASFPSDYKFKGEFSTQLRQIGNVFPPKASYVLLRHVRNAMERTDRARRRQEPLLPAPPLEAIVVDGDDDDNNRVIVIDDGDDEDGLFVEQEDDQDVIILDDNRPSSAASSHTVGRPDDVIMID
ncbi:S-adenosyl-L-methionine-dependent methyltransferase [Apiospora marii]|uniref:DNA (cytosine-5-)-methyltransferase n=1 Tax=Apiospora marii TaxID=335849 RepID=A0ABR1RYJ6_9PEZI